MYVRAIQQELKVDLFPINTSDHFFFPPAKIAQIHTLDSNMLFK